MASGFDAFLGGLSRSAGVIGAGLGARAKQRRENEQLTRLLNQAMGGGLGAGIGGAVPFGSLPEPLNPGVLPFANPDALPVQPGLGSLNPLQAARQQAAQADQLHQREQAAFMMNLIPLATQGTRGAELAKFAVDAKGQGFVNQAAQDIKKADSTIKSIAATAAINGNEAAIQELRFAERVAGPTEKSILSMIDPNNLQGSIAQMSVRLDQSGKVAEAAIDSRFTARDERLKSDLEREEIKLQGDIDQRRKETAQTIINEQDVTTNDVAREEVAKAIGKSFGDMFTSDQKLASDSNKNDDALSNLERLSDKAFIGGGGSYKETLARGADALGIDIDGLSETDQFKAISSELVLDEIANFKGAVSDKDLEIAKDATINARQTPEGVKQVVAIKRKLNQRSREIAKLQRDYIQENGTIDNGWLEAKQQFVDSNPLFDDQNANPANTELIGSPPPMTAINPTTNERLISNDGGNTWEPIR